MAKNQKPTKRQITAIQLINNGVAPGQAMIKAGYSKTTARHPKRFLMESEGLKTVVDKFKIELEDRGITTAYLAGKYKEWLDAEDPVVTAFGILKDKDTGAVITRPDRRIQIEAAKMLKDIFSLTPTKKDTEPLKRRVTFEEFVMGDTPKDT